METLRSSHPQQLETARNSADYHPSVWGDYFLSFHPNSPYDLASLKPKIDEFKEDILQMFNNTSDALQSLELIDTIQRLGVSYHFEKEIDGVLRSIYEATNGDVDDEDLYSVALHFRLLRQQRYIIPTNVFKKFLDENGDFKNDLSTDAKALLSLFEAANIGMPEEDILDKAIIFSKTHLKSMKSEMDPHLDMMVSTALEIPLFKRNDRMKTRIYISIYEQDSKCNGLLLDFAKMDFLCLQAMHQDEARRLSMWWKKLGLSMKLPFSRDRLIECYFWVLSVYFEPYNSRARVMMTKFITQMSLLDDIYDVYGTLDELNLLTDVIERWDLESIEKLPEYLHHSTRALFDTFKEVEAELAPEKNSFRLDYLKVELKKVAKEYLTEKIWGNKCYVPKLEEHLSVTLVTAGYSFLTCASFIGMEEVIPKSVFDWVASFPEIIKASCLIGRLMNDIVSYELEQKRTHVASTVQCYVMEHKCSEEEACNKLVEMSNNAWKIINREFLMLNKLPLSLVWPALNLARYNEYVYLGKDIYTHADENMKKHINAVLIDSLHINSLKN